MACTLHEVQEYIPSEAIWIYPYRCSRCKQCFLCGHKQENYEYWVCADGFKMPTTPDPGVPVNGN